MFDALLQEFLAEAGFSNDEFVQAADAAEGMNGLYLQLFLAHVDYSVFIKEIGEEYCAPEATCPLSIDNIDNRLIASVVKLTLHNHFERWLSNEQQ